jgi:hypothetical protein
MLGDKLRKEFAVYVSNLKVSMHEAPLFYSQQRREGMSANTVAQLFLQLYAAGRH